MLRERYEPLDLFAYVPTLSLAMDPVLARLDAVLDDDTLFQLVKADLATRHPRTTVDGRPSTPVEVILRLLVVKHLYGWSYEETEHFVADSLVLRPFCRVYAERVPDDTTLLRWANCIRPETLHALLDHVVGLARQFKVTRGRKLRIDSTVVETDIHYPSDSTLLYDGVRVLSRALAGAKRARAGTAALGGDACRDRTRSAKRQMKRITDAARQRGAAAEAAMHAAYRRLVEVATATVARARRAGAARRAQAPDAGNRAAAALDRFVPLVEQVIGQTTRRVLHGAAVPAGEKVVSLFEPHTAVIRKGKFGRPVEFGRVVWLDEVEGGIVSRYAVLAGNPDDQAQLPPSLAHHRRLFRGPPRLLAGDRHVHSSANERHAAAQGVHRVVLPQPGAKSAQRLAHERQRWFRRGRDWRAGIAGRISGLKRRHGLDRCRYHGGDGMERWVGWGIIAHDLRVIAQATAR